MLRQVFECVCILYAKMLSLIKFLWVYDKTKKMTFYRGPLPLTIHPQPLMKPQTLGLDASPNESVPN